MSTQKSYFLFTVFILALSICLGRDSRGSEKDAKDEGATKQHASTSAIDCKKINRCSPHVGFGPAPCQCEKDLAGGKGICPEKSCKQPQCKSAKSALVYWEASKTGYRNPVWGKTHMTIPSACTLPEACLNDLEVYLEYGVPTQAGKCARKFPVTSFKRKKGSDACFDRLQKCKGKGIHVEVRSEKETGPRGHFTYATLGPPY